MSKNKRVSLQDVADLVGVTKMTVSRYLNDATQVSVITREKIQYAIDELGYIPNRAPAMLLNAASQVIGVLIPSLTNSVFSEVLRGIEKITVPANYQIMLAHYGYDPQKEEQFIESLLSYNIDGLLLSESVHTQKTIKMIRQTGIPVVEMFDIGNPLMQAVGFDNFKAAREMTELMIHRGHMKIVYLAARMDVRTKIKYEGYCAAMVQNGLKPRHCSTEAASSFSLGSQLLNEVLAQYPDCDGIFCTNDDLAIGVIFECQRLNIVVPDQLGVAGFHGLDVGQAMNPKLASVMTPREEIGRIAAKELIDRLEEVPYTERIIDLGYIISMGQSL